MEDNETGVTEPESPAGGSEPQSPEVDVQPEGGATERQPKENHIPISRAEEMWKKRQEKLEGEWRSKEEALQKQLKEHNDKLVNGQLAWLKSMGWYKDEPEKPLTRAELEQMMKQNQEQFRREMMVASYEDKIRAGWEQVSTKWPKLAGNQRFQNAVLASYAQAPNIPLVQHAEAYVKELLDPYSTERAKSLQDERDARHAPDRRVVPSGRGAGAGAGGNKGEKKKSIADRIRDRLSEKE